LFFGERALEEKETEIVEQGKKEERKGLMIDFCFSCIILFISVCVCLGLRMLGTVIYYY
jgi:hypothetical protein